MNAQEIFEEQMKSLFNDLKELDSHTRRVVELCEKFADNYPDDVDRELLLDAAWLHDIAKFCKDKHHNDPLKVKKLIKKNYKSKKLRKMLKEQQWDADDKHIKYVVNIIKAHKGKFNPDKKKMESAVLRLCDKLDRYSKGKDDCKEKCNETLQDIEKKLKEKKYNKLKDFYDSVCFLFE